jgi:hypothetical protein
VLRENLVLHVDAGNPGVLVAAYRAVDVGDGLPERIGVHDHRYRDDPRAASCLLDHLGRGEGPVVGNGVVHHGGRVAAHVCRLETHVLDDASRERTDAIGGDERLAGEKFSEGLGLV